MPTLYYLPGSAAMAPQAALEEAGGDYDLVRVMRENDRIVEPANYLDVNPLGRVPAYVDGDLVLWESAAIVMHIADRNPQSGLLPAVGSDGRAIAVRWLVYLTNTLQATFMHFAYPSRLVPDADAEVKAAVSAGAAANLAAGFGQIDGVLASQPYLVGSDFTAADLYLFMLTRWCRRLPRKAWTLPNVGNHYARLGERPSVERMLERQGIVAYPED